MDENTIIRRLAEGSMAHQINWTDNGRCKELSTEAVRTREKTLSYTNVRMRMIIRKTPTLNLEFLVRFES